ncbi:MAG: YbaK/EbsC family protein [Candidatus Aenigmarchaeota archaeon]|nr:YbaK/EbsC family protein [Candidatus Aenigmarchaeota archaeon]
MLDPFRDFLEKNSIWHEFLEKEDTRSVAKASNASGIDSGSIVKSLVFLADGERCLILLQGSRTVDRKKVRKLLRAENIALASPGQVLEATGYEVGAVPPVGHATKLRCILDTRAARLHDAWAGGGTKTRLVRLHMQDIVRLTGPRIADVSEEASH